MPQALTSDQVGGGCCDTDLEQAQSSASAAPPPMVGMGQTMARGPQRGLLSFLIEPAELVEITLIVSTL